MIPPDDSEQLNGRTSGRLRQFDSTDPGLLGIGLLALWRLGVRSARRSIRQCALTMRRDHRRSRAARLLRPARRACINPPRARSRRFTLTQKRIAMNNGTSAAVADKALAPEHARAVGGILGADARQHRRRLWRYRHQPALCVARIGHRGGRRRQSGERTGRARHSVADHLGAADRRDCEIRADAAARRQQRRRRHAGADGAGIAQRRAAHIVRDPARHRQRRAVLRRCHDHAGAVRSVRRRGLEDRHAGIRALSWCRSRS